jgi:predicted dehydrogenase
MGYWGRNLFRVLSNSPHLHLKAVVDKKPEALEKVRAAYPNVSLYTELAPALDEVDAVVIATPVASHYALAMSAVGAGKHVLIEKPLCRSGDEAAKLVAAADAAGVTLMVDHTFLFHPAVQKLSELMSTGALGQISYYDSQRINLGLFQPDVNVLWDLAPHDLSIIDHLFKAEPIEIEASGYCHVNPTSPDIGFITLHYPNDMVAHLNLSWMSPVKVRRIAVGGSDKMVVWDDLNRDEPLKIYDSGINILPQSKRETILPSYRVGSVMSPRLVTTEPLVEVVEHFRQVILKQVAPRMDGHQGLRIVRTLERAQTALDLSLRRVRSRTKALIRSVAAE